MNKFIIEKGFKSQNEYDILIGIAKEHNVKNFIEWKNKSGTKTELLRIIMPNIENYTDYKENLLPELYAKVYAIDNRTTKKNKAILRSDSEDRHKLFIQIIEIKKTLELDYTADINELNVEL